MSTRTVQSLDEFQLIARIQKALATRATQAVLVGSGDDGAVLRLPAARDLVVSTDAAVEGVHFRFDWQRPGDIGTRSFNAALSDLAAMGAAPLSAVVAMTLPPALPLAALDGIARGIGRAAATQRCPVVGGNLARARECTITTTVFGHVTRGRALRRSAARVGDRVFVTGALGAGALALAKSRAGVPARHVPSARLAAGRALAGLAGVGACIDLSDGLAADLAHLLSASGCGAEIWPDRLPLARGVGAWCRRAGSAAIEFAATGGEDYELLFTLRPARGTQRPQSASALAKRLGVAVSEIGCIVSLPGVRGLERTAGAGFRHFRGV